MPFLFLFRQGDTGTTGDAVPARGPSNADAEQANAKRPRNWNRCGLACLQTPFGILVVAVWYAEHVLRTLVALLGTEHEIEPGRPPDLNASVHHPDDDTDAIYF